MSRYLTEFSKLAGVPQDIPDELFAEQFATKMRAEGTPMSVDRWESTMRVALGRNIGEAEETRYNKFDLAKVAKALRKFEGLVVTPARRVGPVVYIEGPAASLGALLKRADKLKTSEAELEPGGKLRLAWY